MVDMADMADVSIGKYLDSLTKFDIGISAAISELRKNNKRPDIKSIFSCLIKSKEYEDLTVEIVEDRTCSLLTEGKIINKKMEI